MIERILTVGGWTLVSRLTGFLRDILMAAILGGGPVTDAFLVAFRLPNHFRSIFAEGAFNAAFLPAYARVREQEGGEAAGSFANRIFTLLLASQLVLLALAMIFTPAAIRLLAPGFEADPVRFPLSVALTRITFPYLLLMTLVTLYGGILNATNRFWAPSAAPILLNLSMMATLLLAPYFPNAGYAAAWGVLISGVLQVALVGGDLLRSGVILKLQRPRWDGNVRQFFYALGPATIGSASVQLAMFADTIIASFLPAGALTALYFADRLYQLPMGVIGIAAGTVLLPEMARRIAVHDEAGARYAQNRAIEFTLVLSIPCVVAFLVVPNLIMRALFLRGAFTPAEADAAGATLAAYSIGLLPVVLIRSLIATFQARGDTATPVRAALIAVAFNVAFKVLLMGPLAQVGLALATSLGAWINFALVLWFAAKRGLVALEPRLARSVVSLITAGLVLALITAIVEHPVRALFAPWGRVGTELAAGTLAAVGAGAYAAALLALFGPKRLKSLRGRSSSGAS
jgi:putative peptidoglycan lipid II flippase